MADNDGGDRDGLLDFTRPFDRDGLILNGRKADARITRAIASAQAERTMEGPSTLALKVNDPAQWLLRQSGLFVAKKWPNITAETEGLRWTLERIDKTPDGVELQMLGSAAVALKRTKGAFKLGRDRFTRAEVVHGLCNKAGVAFASPDEHDKQPIQRFTRADEQARRAARREATAQANARADTGGSRALENAKVKGQTASAEQKRHIAAAMKVAEAVGAFPDHPRATKAMLVAGIGESNFTAVPNAQGSGYHGVFQGSKTVFSIGDTAGMAESFFKGGKGFQAGGALHLARVNPSMSPGTIATLVEASGKPGSFYDVYGAEADAIMAAWSPGSDEQTLADLASRTGTPSVARVKKYEFQVGPHENYWVAGRRLADEVGWRLFEINGTVWFVDDLTLAQAVPSMVISEHNEGIDNLDWTATRRGRIDEMTVNCRLTKWAALPGQVIVVEGEGPAADGRWLVRSITRDLLDTSGSAEVTLGRPQDPKPEPRAGIVTRAGTSPASDGNNSNSEPARGGSALVGYPLAKHGVRGSTPADHARRPLGNWQSDNAVDIGVPMGTDVFAVDDGTIEKLGGAWGSTTGSVINGFNVTIKTADNEWFYTHLRERDPGLFVGKEVKRGDYLGKSGAANSAEHLHIACKVGDPMALLGLT